MEFWLNYIIIIILYIILYQSWTNLKLVSKSNDSFSILSVELLENETKIGKYSSKFF